MLSIGESAGLYRLDAYINTNEGLMRLPRILRLQRNSKRTRKDTNTIPPMTAPTIRPELVLLVAWLLPMPPGVAEVLDTVGTELDPEIEDCELVNVEINGDVGVPSFEDALTTTVATVVTDGVSLDFSAAVSC